MKQILSLTLQRFNASTNSEKVKRLVWGMAFVLLCGSFSIANAQQCDSQADFNFTFGVGCNVSFQPVNTNGSHFWTFETVGTGVPSASNHLNPTHTFGAFTSNLRRVTHTITISGVTYTCTKFFTLNCQEGCDDRVINYVVDGCVVKFWSAFTLLTWDFGDGAFSNLATPTHTYAATGTYTVTVTLANGQVCRKTITVNCESSGICCTPNFTAEIRRECSELYLSLSAECTTGGTHSWSFFPSIPGACMDMANFFQGMPVQGMIQLTNINTCEMTAIRVQHTYTCPNGVVLQQTQNIPINDPGIYIGINNTTTQLTDYNCVLPGASYTGGCTVYSTGYVEIDKSFTFSNSLVKMHPGESGFNVINLNDFTLNQNTEVSANTECPCLWRGVEVSNARMFTDSDATIKDALFAIRGLGKSRLDIKRTHFLKNFIGIRATNGLFTLLSFEDNEFDGAGVLKDICVLEPHIADVLVPFYNGSANFQSLDPVIFLTSFGLSGLYLERYNLQLPPLSASQKNEFKNLAYGIMAFDGNVKIDQNSLFSNIPPNILVSPKRSGGVFFVDRLLNGVNTFCFIGHNGSITDFQNCYQGMHIRSEQNIAPTSIGITNTYMDPVHTGIFLDSRFSGGEMIGQGNVGDFVGIKHNNINANWPGLQLIMNAGIAFLDFSSGVSGIEISNNIVNLSYMQGFGSIGSTGISANGAVGSDPGPGVVEADIFENRVVMNNGASNGISLGAHPNGWIRNNSGGNLAGGNGIFITSGQSWSGLLVNLNSNNNLVACNDVVVSSGVDAGLLSVESSQEGRYIFNKLEGPGNGAHFEFGCDNAEFRCNQMIDNTIGLLYDNGAVTGDQGTPTVTYGNEWTGTFSTWGALADNSVNVSTSQVHVRPVANEVPPSVDPPSGAWVVVSSAANPIIDCILEECPAPAPKFFMLEARFTGFDSLVVQGLDARFEAEQVWQHEYNLWKKLTDYSDLSGNNPLAQSFLASHSGSNLETFGALQSNIRSTLKVEEAQQDNMEADLNLLVVLEAEIFALDSLLQITEDSLERMQLQQDITEAEVNYNLKLVDHQILCADISNQRAEVLGALIAEVNAIVPTNQPETNLARVYEIYLQTVASGLEADSLQLADLAQIASQCPWEGGPGVSYAAVLHQGFTGILPASEGCNPIGERVWHKEPVFELSLYPNPNTGAFEISLPEAYRNQSGWLRILDARGSVVKSFQFDGEEQINSISLNLSHLPSGLYFTEFSCSGCHLTPVSFLIQR